MSLLDSNGRLFGRLNIIDAVAAAVAAGAILAAAVGYRSLHGGGVEIDSLTPSSVAAGKRARVHVSGAGFRPYLQAYVAPAGVPLVLTQADRMSQKSTYLLSSAIDVELELPELAPGSYDLYLYDQGRQVAVRPTAVTVAAPQPKATREVRVRFYLPDETVPLIKNGDRDQPGGAVITDVRQSTERSDVMEMHLVDQDNVWTGQKMTGQLTEITLDVPQVETSPDHWAYGDRPILAGNIFLITTDRYRLHGVVTWVGDIQRKTKTTP